MIVALAASALVAIQGTDSLLTRGVSHELARYRAAHIRDVHYDLTLDVTRRDTAYGSVRVSFTRRNGGDAILDFRGYDLSRLRVNGAVFGKIDYNGAHLRIGA